MRQPGTTLKWRDPRLELPAPFQDVIVCVDSVGWRHPKYDKAYLSYDRGLWIADGCVYDPDEIGWWAEFPPVGEAPQPPE